MVPLAFLGVGLIGSMSVMPMNLICAVCGLLAIAGTGLVQLKN